MDLDSPIVAALDLDADSGYVADAATELARRLKRPIVPVHAQSRLAMSGDAVAADAKALSAEILSFFGQALDEGITVAEPIVSGGDATDLVLEVAARSNAHMIVLGPGRPSTIVQWLLGSTAYNIVRNARQPVFLARGTLPTFGRLIVCPVDLSPQSHLALTAAVRMSRAFDATLRIVHSVGTDKRARLSGARIAKDADHVEEVEAKLKQMLEPHDTKGIEIEVRVVGGRPSTSIVENSLDAQLVVLGSRDFRYLLPGTFGSTTEKVLRGVRCSVLAVRDTDQKRADREERLQRIGRLRKEARDNLDADPARAVELARLACLYAPMNAALQELLADAYEKLGQVENAEDARQLAARIRQDFT